MTTNQIVNFRKGDIVKTSRNKTGIIIKPSRIEIGYYDNGKWNTLAELPIHKTNTQQIVNLVEYYQVGFTEEILDVIMPNTVRLGNRNYEITSDNLTLVKEVHIKLPDSVKLNNSQASQLVQWMIENKVWYHFL